MVGVGGQERGGGRKRLYDGAERQPPPRVGRTGCRTRHALITARDKPGPAHVYVAAPSPVTRQTCSLETGVPRSLPIPNEEEHKWRPVDPADSSLRRNG